MLTGRPGRQALPVGRREGLTQTVLNLLGIFDGTWLEQVRGKKVSGFIA